ncbi:protein ALP1-like [Formica exsecta]|uniref:protein ALP1-like n=1 Tax=Formica exsecta TaxID=72781 RepID=UPI0011419B8C|nr:protein ALP1-like [Formica exsecta]
MEIEDKKKFVNYFRMDPIIFQESLKLVGPSIVKQYVIRDPIPPETRLHITLRYLASGDSMASISYAYRIGNNTVSKIISETCEEIWNALKETVFLHDNPESWQEIADEFERLWNYPNCVGCIDGKHVTLQAPPNSGSTHYNYKGYHSINLLAISDAKYRFTMVDIGAEGRQSDGGVFRNSNMGRCFEEGTLKLPNAKPVEINGPVLPYVLLADEAFPLTAYMMRPYPRSSKLDLRKKVFNYRLSRARRVVESAFGILAARWRIYRRPIIARITNARKIVQATVALHNFIITNKEKLLFKNTYAHITPEDRSMNSQGFSSLPPSIGRFSNSGIKFRNAYSEFFIGTGALSFQWEKAMNNDF